MRSLSLLASAAVASARVLDSLSSVPEGWALERAAQPSDQVALKISLRQQHAVALEQAVLAMSTPGSPDYGNHLSREELRAYVAPAAEATEVSSSSSSWTLLRARPVQIHR